MDKQVISLTMVNERFRWYEKGEEAVSAPSNVGKNVNFFFFKKWPIENG